MTFLTGMETWSLPIHCLVRDWFMTFLTGMETASVGMEMHPFHRVYDLPNRDGNSKAMFSRICVFTLFMTFLTGMETLKIAQIRAVAGLGL